MARVLQISHVEQTFNFLAPLIRNLAGLGHDVHVASTFDKGGALLDRYLEGIEVSTHQVPAARRVTASTFTTDLAAICRFLREHRFDVVHVHGPLPSYQVRLAARLAGTPHVIYHAHGFYFHDRMGTVKRRLALAIERFFCRRLSDAVITINREDTALARSEGLAPRPDRLVYAPGVGIDVDRFRPAEDSETHAAELRRELGLPDDALLVIFVGRLVREKGILDLASAFGDLAARHPRAHLLIVGEALESERDQGAAVHLGSIVQPWVESRRILPLGRREDVSRLLQAADVYVLPSYREGMPVALMEAMATGVACLASNIRGCRDAITHAESGALFEAADQADLSRRLEELLGDAELRARLGRRARETIVQGFSIERALPPVLELYERLVEVPVR